jgi:GT2 family glycosyltransferase
MINVCIPVLNSYEELYKCIDSINNSSVKIDNIYIINNGEQNIETHHNNVRIMSKGYNIGVAGSWNWFIDTAQEFRIITNDDIQFDENAIEEMIKNYAEDRLVFPCFKNNEASAFSCFLLPQNIINKIGKFDEWISPNYAYFEDNDYFYRMALAGFYTYQCSASVSHTGSSTLKNFDPAKERSHHQKFRFARDRYVSKWGGLPYEERFTVPFNGVR